MPENATAVRREVTLHASREEVWRALTEPELAEQWLADEVELDLRDDGEVVVRYDGGEERHGLVREVVEEERLRISWHGGGRGEGQVEFVLADAAAGTRLIVVESVSAPSAMAESWGDRLFALEVLSLVRGAAARLPVR
jgi:uncharacterized protein YndB with AHSA1/START domain